MRSARGGEPRDVPPTFVALLVALGMLGASAVLEVAVLLLAGAR